MPTKQQIAQSISRAKAREKRQKAKQKKTAPAGIHAPPGGWGKGAISLPPGYLNILRVGVDLVPGAGKNAERINGSLGIAKGSAASRVIEAEGLLKLIDEADPARDFVVPPHLVPVAQIGTKYEASHVSRGKQAQLKLEISDTKPQDKRLEELGRLARLLGIQGDLVEQSDKESGSAKDEEE
jgi:hypothetical protein